MHAARACALGRMAACGVWLQLRSVQRSLTSVRVRRCDALRVCCVRFDMCVKSVVNPLNTSIDWHWRVLLVPASDFRARACDQRPYTLSVACVHVCAWAGLTRASPWRSATQTRRVDWCSQMRSRMRSRATPHTPSSTWRRSQG